MAVAVRVIPCLDVAAGRVVKGINFQNLRDAGDPVELARRYYEQGADELTFLDVTATVEARATTYEMVRRTAEQVKGTRIPHGRKRLVERLSQPGGGPVVALRGIHSGAQQPRLHSPG